MLDLNETIANSSGYHVTEVIDPGTGAKTTYMHDSPTLEGSDVIYTQTGLGFAWTDQGWNSGSPVWNYGYTAAGNAVLKILSVTGINADWVNAGKLSAEYLDILINGNNLIKNAQFDLGVDSASAPEDIPTNSYTFFPGASQVGKYGWTFEQLGIDVPWFLSGWIYNALSPQEFSYKAFEMLSNGISIVPGEAYTLSILDGRLS